MTNLETMQAKIAELKKQEQALKDAIKMAELQSKQASYQLTYKVTEQGKLMLGLTSDGTPDGVGYYGWIMLDKALAMRLVEDNNVAFIKAWINGAYQYEQVPANHRYIKKANR